MIKINNYILVRNNKFHKVVTYNKKIFKSEYKTSNFRLFNLTSRLLINEKIFFINIQYGFPSEKEMLIASKNSLILVNDKADEKWILLLEKLLNFKYDRKRKKKYYSEKYSPTTDKFNEICKIYEQLMEKQEHEIDVELLNGLKEYFSNINNIELENAKKCITFEKKLLRSKNYG